MSPTEIRVFAFSTVDAGFHPRERDVKSGELTKYRGGLASSILASQTNKGDQRSKLHNFSEAAAARVLQYWGHQNTRLVVNFAFTSTCTGCLAYCQGPVDLLRICKLPRNHSNLCKNDFNRLIKFTPYTKNSHQLNVFIPVRHRLLPCKVWIPYLLSTCSQLFSKEMLFYEKVTNIRPPFLRESTLTYRKELKMKK